MPITLGVLAGPLVSACTYAELLFYLYRLIKFGSSGVPNSTNFLNRELSQWFCTAFPF